MSATIRAAVSLLALTGFYVLAFAIIAGTIIGAYLLADELTVMYWVMALAAAAGIVVIATLCKAAFSRTPLQNGVDVTPEEAPELWALVKELSDAARTRGPEQIRLVSDANAGVSEDTRFLGLFGGHRRMYLGVPLLQGLSVTQLRAVLAHEFGHYSGAHTRLGPIAYRGWQAVVDTMRAMKSPDASWLLRVYGWVLQLYAGTYFMVSLAVTRSQEREADRLMVQVAGRANAQAALREVHVTAEYWSFYLKQFIGFGYGFGLMPTADGFFGGFGRLLAARADELDALRDKALPTEGSPMDTHPTTAERIAAMETQPDRTDRRPDDDRPASALLPAFATAAAATAEKSYQFGDCELLEWDDLIARACEMDDQRAANIVYEAAARLAKEPKATLATVAALSEAGRAAELIDACESHFYGMPRKEFATEMFAILVRTAAVHSGAARWRMSWSGPTELVGADGEKFDTESVTALLADAKTAGDAATRLTALGVDPTAVGEA